MANVFIEESTLAAIGSAIRAKTGKSDGILPSDMPTEIASIEVGTGGGGNDSYYDTFWDTFQKKGQPANYQYAFARKRFDDTNYNPKYPIVCANESGAAQGMFYASNVTDTKVPIDLTGLTYSNGTTGIFTYSYYLKTIRKLILAETVPDITIRDCPVVNITIEGTCGCNFNVGSCKNLTRESMLSILDHLSSTATGKTVTFSQVAKEAAFTETEWEALKIEHSNWTIALA